MKQNETRSWRTLYRGDLVICSAKRKPTLEEVGDLATYTHAMTMPYGCALCIVEVFGCVPTEQVPGFNPPLSEAELSLGDYTPGRFAWLTRNCRRLKQPVPVIGRQGFWTLDAQTEAAIKEVL